MVLSSNMYKELKLKHLIISFISSLHDNSFPCMINESVSLVPYMILVPYMTIWLNQNRNLLLPKEIYHWLFQSKKHE